MGEAACSPSCAGRLCGRQLCATVLVVQEVHHHRHQRLRRHLPPKKQRLLPTLTWQMSVTPATRPEIQGPAERERCRISSNRRRQERNSATSPPREGDRPPPQPTPGSTFTPRKRFPLWYTIAIPSLVSTPFLYFDTIVQIEYGVASDPTRSIRFYRKKPEGGDRRRGNESEIRSLARLI